MKHAFTNILLATAVTFGTVCAQAATLANSNFIVQDLSTKPEFAQNTSQDLLLHDGDNGSTYLYVEQRQGAILAVFDVTNPDHMKLTASVHTEARGSYDFVFPIGANSELIAFRDGSGTAVLDLRKGKTPRITPIEGSAALPTEMLGTAGYLASTQHATPAAPAQLRDIQLIETNQAPHLRTTVTGVTKQIARQETGTLFLLGDDKVTVIRRMDSERDYAFQRALSKQ
jgi:hypothetical protein